MAVEVIRKLSLVVFVWRILRDGDNIYIFDVESFVNYKSTRHIRTNFVKDSFHSFLEEKIPIF